MGLTAGDVSQRQVTYSFTDAEKARWDQFLEKNNLTSVGDIIAYYENLGVVIDSSCPNCWPCGGPKALQEEYFECKTYFMEKNNMIPKGTGTCNTTPVSNNNDSQGSSSTSEAALARDAVNSMAQGENDTPNGLQDRANALADAAKTATDAAITQAKNIADRAQQEANDMIANLTDRADQKLASLKSQAESALSSALSKVSSIGAFSLPEIKIPTLKVLDPNKYIQQLIDTFDPSKYLNDQVKNVMDQLQKIEDIRASLEGTRLGCELKELTENLGLQQDYMKALEALGGVVDTLGDSIMDAADNATNGINSAMENVSQSMCEALAEAADMAANGELMAAETIQGIVDSLTQPGTDVDAAMKAVFGDESGKAAEAVAKADTEAGVRMRGNGPCGGGTKDVGGVNHNEPDKELEEENANEKAYYLNLFEKACEAGSMTLVEQYYAILVNDYHESPSLLKGLILKLMSNAPQTKAGISRVASLLGSAASTVYDYGSGIASSAKDYIVGLFTSDKASSDNVDDLGDGNPDVLDNKKNMNEGILESKDEAAKLQTVSDFTKDIENAEKVAQIESSSTSSTTTSTSEPEKKETLSEQIERHDKEWATDEQKMKENGTPVNGTKINHRIGTRNPTEEQKKEIYAECKEKADDLHARHGYNLVLVSVRTDLTHILYTLRFTY